MLNVAKDIGVPEPNESEVADVLKELDEDGDE